MQQNIGDADRAGRMLAGGALAVVFFPLPNGTVKTIVGVASIILFVSSLMGWSLVYFILRRTTRSDKDARPLPRP